MSGHDPIQNHLLNALSPAGRERLYPQLEFVQMPLGKVLYESGDLLRHVYFPTDSIVSLLYVVSFNKPLHLLQLIAALLQETNPAARLWQDKSISSQLTQQASRYATGQRCIR